MQQARDAALLAETLAAFAAARPAATGWRPLRVTVQLGCLSIMLLKSSTVPPALAVPPREWGEVLSVKRPPGSACRPRYDELATLGQALDRSIDGEALVIGDAALNDLLPTVSPKARVLVYRTAFHMRDAHALPGTDVERRIQQWSRLVGGDTPPAERLRLMAELDARFLAVCDEPAWLATLHRSAPEQVRLHQRIGQLGLYRLVPDGSQLGSSPK